MIISYLLNSFQILLLNGDEFGYLDQWLNVEAHVILYKCTMYVSSINLAYSALVTSEIYVPRPIDLELH